MRWDEVKWDEWCERSFRPMPVQHVTVCRSLPAELTPHFPFLSGQVSLPCNILLRTQLLYSLPLIINDISILVSNCIKCLNLFHPIQILASTVASASPSTLNICHLNSKSTTNAQQIEPMEFEPEWYSQSPESCKMVVCVYGTHI